VAGIVRVAPFHLFVGIDAWVKRYGILKLGRHSLKFLSGDSCLHYSAEKLSQPIEA
jgi:hypothetical protein